MKSNFLNIVLGILVVGFIAGCSDDSDTDTGTGGAGTGGAGTGGAGAVIDPATCTDLGYKTYSVDTILDGCYNVSNITINENKLLTIKEGSTLIFESSGTLKVYGAIKAIGTPQKPIVFTGSTKTAGHWQGVQFENAVDTRNMLDNIIIEYAGSWNYGALYTNGATKLSVKNSIIRNNNTNGFYFSEDTDVLEFSNTISTKNEKMAGSIGVMALGAFDNTSDFTGNLGDDYLEVRSGDVTKDQTWKPLTVPVLMDNIYIKVNKLVTIEAGAIFAMKSSSTFEVHGALRAIGTAEVIAITEKNGTIITPAVAAKPVMFTGATKTAGFWRNIYFQNAVDDRNLLDNVIIEYAGSWNYGALYTIGATKLSVKNSIIRNNNTNGFYFSEDTDVLEFSNTISTNNEDMAGSIGVMALGAFDNTSDFTGNTEADYLEVRSGDVTKDQTWKPLTVPVLMNNIDIKENKLVTIEAGTQIAFDSASSFEVHGALKAVGTSASPILFTGRTASKGFWRSIQFQNAIDSRNEIAFATVEYGGGWGNANIYISGATEVNIHDTIIRQSSNAGVNIVDCAATLTHANNTFTDNEKDDITRPYNCP